MGAAFSTKKCRWEGVRGNLTSFPVFISFRFASTSNAGSRKVSAFLLSKAIR